MDPVCEEKINYLQKYIPCLANVIELLANDSEKEGKLAQMQLLYNLLNKPDNSVQIETLEKCEEVLSRVFGSAEEKHDEAEVKARKEENIPNVADCLIKKEVLEDAENSVLQDTEENIKEVCENVNGCSEEQSSGEKEPSSETTKADENPIQVEDVPMEAQSVKDVPEAEPKVPNGIEVEHEKLETSQHIDERIENDADGKSCDIKEKETKEAEFSSERKQSVQGADLITETECSEKEIQNAPPEENSLLIEISDTANEDTLAEELGHHVDESDTFILPDDGDSPKTAVEEDNMEVQETADSQEENFVSSTERENAIDEQQSDVIRQSQTDILPFKIISAESLAIQSVQSLSETDVVSLCNPLDANKEPENPPNNTEKELNVSVQDEDMNDEDLDPLDTMLNPPEELLKTTETPSASSPTENGPASLDPKKTDEKEDDGEDDDVLLIESRSSPIFIDSDPEDEEYMKLHRSLPIMPAKAIVATLKAQQKQQKTSARKSTAVVMDTLRHIIKRHNVSIRKVSTNNKPKPARDAGFLLKKDPKALMETISLLDSDSEDETPKKAQRSKSNDDDVIIVSSTKFKIAPMKKTTMVPLPKQITRIPSKLASKLTGKPTAQSNFLNAVNLQPAPKSNSNPASFSAQLSNKKVIIPNAFYGNPTYNRKATSSSVVSASVDESSSNDPVPISYGASSTVGIRQANDKFLKEWLESFLTNFASPLQIASHACFVLLQRVLKYRFFQRLKETRVNLNTLAKNSVPETMDIQMLLDLRSVFLENDNLTEAGRRFCRFATNEAFGKPVALTTDSRTGKVTCRTRIGSKAETVIAAQKTTKPCILGKPTGAAQVSPPQRQTQTIATVTSANVNPSNIATAVSCTPKRKSKFRKLSNGTLVADDDDNDYTPHKGDLVPEEEIVTERKKSLRTNRTKRKEAGFTYSEDHDDEEFEALAKKLEDKKREELRLAEERELEREREWERKTKKTVAKKTTSKRQGNSVVDPAKGPSRKKLRLADTEILGNADDDLLTPTWVEADGDDGEVDSLLDFADEPQSPQSHVSDDDNNVVEQDPVTIVPEDSDNSDAYPSTFDVNTNRSVKNTDRSLHAQNQSFDFCVHCLRRVSRTVHHYVNEHRSSEVFTARLRTRDIRRLLTTSNVGFVHLYKGNQQQYAAHCIFCDKEVKFLYPYWFEHFTMHTGEYSFKCSGCHIRKPTRSLLTNHLQSGAGCPKKGKAVKLHFFDTKSNQIDANVCTLCNYTQLNRKNVLRHLRTQHGIETIAENHIIKVVLLQVSGPFRDEEEIANDASQLSLFQHSEDEENGINGEDAFDETSLMMQNDFTDNDDLSFMICGMLDVQTNISAETGELLRNADTQNTVDNK